ncbi:hypothetical protein [Actinoplanes rectilineatus]|uniref:hypothetical protein n=1 Tax=Actinoplanes rectilineatus TaxID=113571 RepID=UPI001FE072C3|nr:hypothetical protein [Actinoplanes rectilineatus]
MEQSADPPRTESPVMATFEAWLDAWDAVYDLPPGPYPAACPRCGERCLRLVFTALPGWESGYAHLWCDSCLHGIVISRASVPDDAVVQDMSQPPEEREPRIPNFRLEH